ncbi:geranylgeranyl reductase family protein [Methanimicrococcus blatticola]|uniref:Digeranylgeranylglycerophospholipid reductase n=1 Tax=Methanimicrococcus blatticola TaxID=91560 RepID=A0A484F5Y9_9EURY|nr:NAD(P)/FAD-dependent oxidoreductase [Methanimicrococcus blatticola]MBZ3935591.1 NAD(P)/FAD-dependent oxidoreductase [Methanimicrococcus blatticola]MCC2509232.1 NAD(P)/FAD-dependent oxidoreductase [Methanimicrococcus blatticola]TDQ69402.1 2,3-di-O-geranylgeranylglyceryl phosphate reductase [Methanimicrococcus blatticola]
MKTEYDVIVVGAGPAGSIAAKTAAEKGCSVLLIEKRQEIGVPIRCAEGTSKTELMKFIDIDPSFTCNELHKAEVHAPGSTSFSITTKMSGIDGEAGIILDRKIFDRHLANLAAAAGANVYTKTPATNLIMRDGKVEGVVLNHLGEERKTRSKIVIGADGVESKIARMAGIDTALNLKEIESGAQFLVYDETIDQTKCDIFIGNEIAPGGYIWIFPKGNHTANIGIGILGNKNNGKNAIQYLEKFIAGKFPNAQILGTAFGGVPASGGLKRMTADGLMLAGDAARQTDPITGAGIRYAMYAGKMAGRTAAEAIAAGDYSNHFLQKYQNEWDKTLGKTIRRNYKIKEAYNTWADEDMNRIAQMAAGLPLEDFELKEAIIAVLKSDKKLMWKMKSVYYDLLKAMI